jgi:hypothetical protein
LIRVREEVNLHFQESRRPHGKASGGRIAGYLTDEQRSQAEWIGALKCEVIFERALIIDTKKSPWKDNSKGFRKENVIQKVKLYLHVLHKMPQCNMSSDFMR